MIIEQIRYYVDEGGEEAILQVRREVLWQEVPIQRLERGREPAIVAAIQLPEVLVCIDAHELTPPEQAPPAAADPAL